MVGIKKINCIAVGRKSLPGGVEVIYNTSFYLTIQLALALASFDSNHLATLVVYSPVAAYLKSAITGNYRVDPAVRSLSKNSGNYGITESLYYG